MSKQIPITDTVRSRCGAAGDILAQTIKRHPELECAADALGRAYLAIADSLERGGTLFLCGNGGRLADALHISGELLKSYVHPRPLGAEIRKRLARQPEGEMLAQALEGGLRAVVLGANLSLSSAVDNDLSARGLACAQELLALGRPGDVLLGISTSGQARNVRYAASVAAALDMATIALAGAAGGPLAAQVEIAIRAPASRTDRAQEQHIVLYHCLCEMLELHFFGH